MYVIRKTVPEAKMKQLLGFMDKILSDDVADLAAYILDKHYTIKDGFKQATEQAKVDNLPDVSNNLLQIAQKYDKYTRAYYNGIPKDFYDRSKKIIDDRGAFSKPNVAYGLISQTNLTSGPELNKPISHLQAYTGRS
ncbi:hypothetical protein [Paenibacillus sp. LjRoot56]|uniref:hypothetical protein n=1 Tax=Paenibacillus sp. LjRoot56 TaxID=3342333 RepID=UPI003ECCCE52